LDKKPTQAPKVAEIASKVFALLEPLVSEDRQKVVAATLTLLGEASASSAPVVPPSGAPQLGLLQQGASGLNAKAGIWAKQNGIGKAELEQVFDIETTGVTVIASSAPGKNDKEKTLNAYVLEGVKCLLASGEPSFEDKSARKLCEDLGCLNGSNHAQYLSGKGNLFTGSKSTGWKLTAPGLKHAGALIKELAKEA
jgi:hypothetical protein